MNTWLKQYITKVKFKKRDMIRDSEQRKELDDIIITRVLGLVFILFSLLCFVFIIFFCFSRFTKVFSEIDGPGVIGDLIGGVSAPIVGLIGALLTFLAFWIQYSFNLYQTYSIEQQGKADERNRFEGLFYQMLRIHRENVSEITIKDKSRSRRAFISMFKEFKFCHYVLLDVYCAYKKDNEDFFLSDQKLVNISYLTFFFGIGESSGDIVDSLLSPYVGEFKEFYHKRLREQQNKWVQLDIDCKNYKYPSCKEENMVTKANLTLTIKFGQLDSPNQYNLTTGYKPFTGHLARLGHYYRHLYQTVDFIQKQNPVNKEEYIRIFRAQISAHEQLLLYYNSLTALGNSWWDSNYLIDFKIVKNIPLPLADIKPIPTDKIALSYFEWAEITRSLTE